MVKLIDCCIFNDEVEMLNFRLHELDWVVDKFVIVESNHTFQGHKKELIFEKNKEKFIAFKDKIVYVVHDKLPHPNPWINEKILRNAAGIVIDKLMLSSTDYIGISDVDEVPDSNTLYTLKNTLNVGFLSFCSNFYYYNINWRKPGKMPVTVFGEVGKLYYKFNNDFEEMRHAARRGDPEIKICGYKTYTAGGWHFSYFGSVGKIIKKIKSFAHSEYNKEEYTNPEKIKQLIREGKDLFMRGKPEDLIRVQETYLPKRVDLLPQIII